MKHPDLLITLLGLLWFGSAAAFLSPLHNLPSRSMLNARTTVQQVRPTVQAGRSLVSMRATFVVSVVSRQPQGGQEVYEMKTTYYSSGSAGRTWTVSRRYEQLEEFQRKLNAKLGFVLPVLPPKAILSSDLFPLEDYFTRVLDIEKVQRDPALTDLLDIPKEIREEDSTPSYVPEVLDRFGRPVEGPDGPSNVASGAAVAGGVVGFLLGGPVGAMLGAGMGGLAVNRQDTAGDVARTAGKAANVAIKKVKQIDDRYEVTRKAQDLFKEGYKKVKQAVDKLEES